MASVVYVPLGLASQVVASDAAVDVIVATYSGIKNTRDLVTTPDSE